MAVFFNNQVETQHTYPVNSLIHAYNSKIFEDYESVKTALMNITLLPGEVAFGYYNDPETEYGMNAIFALGPLKNGTGNILFKNADQLDKELAEVRRMQEELR